MENSGVSFMSSKWFNTKLFTVNGAPLKFYLDGYSVSEFYEIVKIIQAYGGDLSEPGVPNTFIFCEPHHSIGVGKYHRYDIQYFYDSIAALQPQELPKYKLQVSPDGAPTINKVRRNSCPLDIKGPKKVSSRRSSSGIEEVPSLYYKTRNSLALDRRKKNRILESPNLRPNSDLNNNSDEIDRNRRENSPEDDENSDDSQVWQSSEDSEEFSPRDRRSLPTGEKRGRPPLINFTEEENEKIIQWLLAKKTMPTENGRKIWQDFIHEKILPHYSLTPTILLGHFKRELKEHPMFDKFSKNLTGPERSANINHRYTEEETRVLIQYLIDRNAINRAKGITIWRECLRDCKGLLHPQRTAISLSSYFKNRLRYKYVKYTDDPEALEAFKKIENKSRERNEAKDENY